MLSAVERFTRNVENPNILTSPTHERQEICMCKTGANFYSIWKDGIKKWNTQYGEVPNNYYLMYKLNNQFPLWLDIDIVLSQNKFGQFQFLEPMARRLQTPLISMEHTLPAPFWGSDQVDYVRSLRGTINIFISNFSLNAWKWEDRGDTFVIEHCVDTDLFTTNNLDRQNHILTVANDYIGRDVFLNYKQYVEVTNGLPVHPIGDTPGLSKPAKNIAELVREYQTSRIFLNTAHWSPIPTSLLEAMSCGCAVVSCATCAIPDYIKDGENGLLAKNNKEMRDKLLLLLNDPVLCNKLGQNARATIIKKCNIDRYIKDWKGIFELAKNL